MKWGSRQFFLGSWPLKKCLYLFYLLLMCKALACEWFPLISLWCFLTCKFTKLPKLHIKIHCIVQLQTKSFVALVPWVTAAWYRECQSKLVLHNRIQLVPDLCKVGAQKPEPTQMNLATSSRWSSRGAYELAAGAWKGESTTSEEKGHV